MKKKQLLFIALIINGICFTLRANASIFRVNNLSNYVQGSKYGDNLGGTLEHPVFAQISDAMASILVSNEGGDTIHVEGTNIVYQNVAITKHVVIMGQDIF